MSTWQSSSILKYVYGVGFTFIIALIGYFLAFLPIIGRIGPLALSIFLAILYRQILGYPENVRLGIQFSSKYLLRLAIILYGLKLNVHVIFEQGIGLLIKSGLVILLSIVLMILFAKWLKSDQQLALLLGIGTGVCGAAAIAAVSPIVKANEEDTAISIGLIAFIGTVFSIIYSIILPLLPLTDFQFGIWSGLSLHELAHVALAAEPAGQSTLAIALLAKLSRVFLLVPLCFIIIFWMKRKQSKEENTNKVPFPLFLVGFILMSIVGTYMLDNFFVAHPNILNGVDVFTTFVLTAAMVGLGLNVDIRTIKDKAFKPALIMIIVSLFVSLLMYGVSFFS